MSMDTQTLDYGNRGYSTSHTSNIEEGESQEEMVENPGRRGLGIDPGLITEIEAYQGLMLDFEREFSEFLSSDLPKCPKEDSHDEDGYENLNEGNRERSRGSSEAVSSRSSFDGGNKSGASGGIHYNFDGTISCCDISYDLLVSLICQHSYINYSFYPSINRGFAHYSFLI